MKQSLVSDLEDTFRADQHMRAGGLAAMLLHQELALQGRQDLLKVRAEAFVRKAFLRATAKLANYMVHVLDAEWWDRAEYDEIVGAIGPPFLHVAALEVVKEVEQQDTRRLRGPLPAPSAEKPPLAPLYLSAEEVILDCIPTVIGQPTADGTAETIDDAAPVEEISAELSARFRAIAPAFGEASDECGMGIG